LLLILGGTAYEAPAEESHPVEIRKNVQYGTGAGEPLTLNMAIPAGFEERLPVIMFIHGGGWIAGNKESLPDDLLTTAAQGGYFVVSVGYRLAPKHVFPAQIEDCKCAVRYLRANAKELNIDPERIGAVGFSAGAHLAMLLGTMDPSDGLEGEGGWSEESSKVQVAVSYAGPTNLDAEYPDASKRMVSAFIGGARSDKVDQYRRASPISYVSNGDAPLLLFQGTVDVLVPYEQGIQMARAMTEAKVPGRVELLIGHNHGWPGKELERTQKGTYAFLDQYLKTEADDE